VKQLTVLSGKGGTGKTTIAASFASLARNAVLADCDVDAPNLHMLLHPEVVGTEEFMGSKLAIIDGKECTKCGLCRERCRFGAITEEIAVDPLACEGCGVCMLVCPTGAVKMVERVSGQCYVSETKYGKMAHARLLPGQANSGKLVTAVRQKARLLAEKMKDGTIIIDGPPGIGCPVIASVTGVDLGLVVTEPTLSGIHDLDRALQLLEHFNVLPLVCVNMYDVNRLNTQRIVDYCKDKGVKVAGRIPFDLKVTEAMVRGETITEYTPESPGARGIAATWNRVQATLLSLKEAKNCE